MKEIKENHTVALLKSIPSENLSRGDVGAVVSDLSDTMAEVEFVDENGRTTALVALKKKDLMRLRFETVST